MSLWNLKRINDFYKHLRKAPKLFKDSEWQIDFVKKLIKIQEVKEMINMLKGKKTYLVAVLMFALAGLKGIGLIDEPTYQTIMGLLAGLGLTTLRAAVTSETRR